MQLRTARAQGVLTSGPMPGALIDAAIATVVLIGSLALLSHRGMDHSGTWFGELNWVSGLLVACSSLPILAWRRAPLGVFFMTTIASTMLAGLGYSLGLPFGLPLGPTAALYLLASSSDQLSRWKMRTSLAVMGLLVAYVSASAFAQSIFPGTELLHTSLAWAVAWFAGERTRLRREQIADLEERALGIEREAERERRLVLAEERNRIARDLHDSAGHAINVIAVRAGAARMRHDQDSERSRAALETIEEVARQTAADIDQIVGTLRDRNSNGTVETPPGLASLETLVAQHSAAGLHVRVGTVGTARELNVAVDQAAYRILQEALTNASRHGVGTACIDIAFGERALELTVTNPVPPLAETRPDGGHGLIGMRERARLVGGSLQEQCANGAFRVCARLFYDGPPP